MSHVIGKSCLFDLRITLAARQMTDVNYRRRVVARTKRHPGEFARLKNVSLSCFSLAPVANGNDAFKIFPSVSRGIK